MGQPDHLPPLEEPVEAMHVNALVDQRVLQRLRAEFLEMPGMKLRSEQVQRLCGIDPATCGIVLDALVKAKFLCLKPDGMYVRLTDGTLPVAHAAKATRSPMGVAKRSLTSS